MPNVRRQGLAAVAAAAGTLASLAGAASGAGATISVTLSASGTPLTLRISGSMPVAAALAWVSLEPGASACPAEPASSTHVVFHGPVSGPGAYGADSGQLDVSQGAYSMCGWLTSAADPTDVLAATGPINVEIAAVGTSPPPAGGPGGGGSGGSAPAAAPRVTALRAVALTHGAARVSLTLSAAATVVLTLVHGGHAVGSATRSLPAGASTVTVRRWSGHLARAGSDVLLARTSAGARHVRLRLR